MLLTQTPKQRLNQSPVSTLHHPYDPLLHLNQQKVSIQTVNTKLFKNCENKLCSQFKAVTKQYVYYLLFCWLQCPKVPQDLS